MGLRQLKKLLAQLYAANSDDCYNSLRGDEILRSSVPPPGGGGEFEMGLLGCGFGFGVGI